MARRTRNRRRLALALNWYDLRLHQGVLKYASEHGWDVYDFHQRPQDALSFHGDGLIVLRGPAPVYDELQRAYEGRLVVVGSISEDQGVPFVLPDDLAIGRCAAEHLIARGFSTLIAAQPWPSSYIEARTRGFAEAAANAGCHVRVVSYGSAENEELPDDWDDELPRWFERQISRMQRPLGLYAPLDAWAQLLVRICGDLNIHVPEELAIVGTNNDPVICPYTNVPLSSVDMNWETIGIEATRRLDQLLSGKEKGGGTYVAPTGVRTRRSTDIMAVADIRVARAVRYIHDNLFEAISAADVAKAVQMPLRTLQLGFKTHLKHGIRHEIGRGRVEEIKRLLRETDMTASQISDMLNFSSVFAMLRLFKSGTGLTTRQYRAKTLRTQPAD